MSVAPITEGRGVLTGKRKIHHPRGAVPLKWPTDKKDRLELFDAWHDVAMQVVHIAQDDFRLLAAIRKVLMFTSGEITATNREIAWRAGHCSDKTVTRLIQRYSDLGLLIVTKGWKSGRCQLLQTRRIKLALPARLDEKVRLPDASPFEFDTRGPDGWDTRGLSDHNDYRTDNSGPSDSALRTDTRGPDGWDTRGPGISRETREGGRKENRVNGTVEPGSEPEVR